MVRLSCAVSVPEVGPLVRKNVKIADSYGCKKCMECFESLVSLRCHGFFVVIVCDRETERLSNVFSAEQVRREEKRRRVFQHSDDGFFSGDSNERLRNERG